LRVSLDTANERFFDLFFILVAIEFAVDDIICLQGFLCQCDRVEILVGSKVQCLHVADEFHVDDYTYPLSTGTIMRDAAA